MAVMCPERHCYPGETIGFVACKKRLGGEFGIRSRDQVIQVLGADHFRAACATFLDQILAKLFEPDEKENHRRHGKAERHPERVRGGARHPSPAGADRRVGEAPFQFDIDAAAIGFGTGENLVRIGIHGFQDFDMGEAQKAIPVDAICRPEHPGGEHHKAKPKRDQEHDLDQMDGLADL